MSFAWGHSPDHFPYTNDIATVTGDGTVSADLSGRVLPGYTNYGKFLIETATGLSDGVLNAGTLGGTAARPNWSSLQWLKSLKVIVR